ncbi:sensor domain-containing protein [Kitasatospora sp. NPDC056138]|uniref:sensor domain-containing protein n=1 Tax=Kitasatospora sp. NPDC056138 TaxID=3345724 RepID=UPI0035D8406E
MPAPPRQPKHSGYGLRRLVLPVALVAALTLAAVGWLTRLDQPAAIPHHAVAGTVQADVLTPDQVSKLVGTALVSGPSVSKPPAELIVDPSSCAVAAGPATQSVYGHGWSAFLSTTYQNPAGVGEVTVTQVIGVYSDGDKADSVFRTLSDGLKACPFAVRTDPDRGTSAWAYKADPATQDTLGWTATQDTGDGWACYGQARLKGKAVIQVGLCEAGDGKPAATKIADQFAAKVNG